MTKTKKSSTKLNAITSDQLIILAVAFDELILKQTEAEESNQQYLKIRDVPVPSKETLLIVETIFDKLATTTELKTTAEKLLVALKNGEAP